MSALVRWALITTLTIAPAAHAQTCSGGADGGMDATGHQCNARGSPSAASGDTFSEPWLALRQQGLTDYERGNFDAAVNWFRRAAGQGDVRSAVMIVLMHRHNAQLYGGRVPVTDDEARQWVAVIGKAASANVAVETVAPR